MIMKKIGIIFLLLILLFGCTTPSDIGTDEDSFIYVKTAIPVDLNFHITSNIQLYNGVLYFGGVIHNETDFQPAIIKIGTEDYSVEYDALTTETSPQSIAVTDNGYAYINSETITITTEQKLSDIFPSQEYLYSKLSLTSADNKIYLACDKKCIVFDEDGKQITSYNFRSAITSMLYYSGDEIYVMGEDSYHKPTMDIIDITTGKQKSVSASYQTGINYFPDTDNMYIHTETDLLKYNFDSGETTTVLNWTDVGLMANSISVIVPTGDDFLALGFDNIAGKFNLFKIERVSADSIPEKTVIRISYMEDGRNDIPLAAIKFNEISADYKVVLEEYRNVADTTNYDELLSKYDADLLTGKLGDVLIMSSETDYKKYAEKGAFCDLYEIIANDDTFSLDILYDCVIKPYEINGELNVIVPEFAVSTLVGKSSNLPKETWNIAAMLDLIAALPDNTALINGMVKASMAEKFLLAGAGEFIDFNSGTCDFDSELFISLIEYIAEYPDFMIQMIDDNVMTYINNEVYLYESIYFGSFIDYIRLKARFGFDEEIEMIGYPSANGGAAKIHPMRYYAVSSSSENTDGAWEFIKFLLSGDAIINEMKGMRYIPSSKETFRNWLETEQMLYYHFPDASLNYRTQIVPITEPSGRVITVTDELIDEFEAFISTIQTVSDIPSTVTEIIKEETDIYFAGSKTAAETAKVIQNRVGIYLSEIK